MSLGLLFFVSYGHTDGPNVDGQKHDAIIQPQNATHDVQKVSYRDD